jgi:hypothetical protein
MYTLLQADIGSALDFPERHIDGFINSLRVELVVQIRM